MAKNYWNRHDHGGPELPEDRERHPIAAEYCDAEHDGYCCTIRYDIAHTVHEAGTGHGVVATWEDD